MLSYHVQSCAMDSLLLFMLLLAACYLFVVRDRAGGGLSRNIALFMPRRLAADSEISCSGIFHKPAALTLRIFGTELGPSLRFLLSCWVW